MVTPQESNSEVKNEDLQEQFIGTLYTSTMDNIKLDNYSNIYQIDLDEDAAQFALYTDGLIKDFTITTVSMNFDTFEYKDEEEKFNVKSFDKDSVVVIKTYFNDVSSHLKVTYTNNFGTTVQYLYQSGKDGSIILS